VQSPIWDDVREILNSLKAGDTYWDRGNKEATRELNAVIETHRTWVSKVTDLKDFPHAAIINGATEGLNQWRMTDTRPWQFLLGDYQWPQIISGNGLVTSIEKLERDRVLYVSNPSCRHGNFLTPSEIERIDAAGCPVILDCAYVGATALREIPIPKRTEQILFSFSKGWGLIGQRAGLLYCKTPHPTLKHMQRVECWNYLTPRIIARIMDRYAVDSMYDRSRPTQARLCKELELVPSDTYFLANSENSIYEKQMRIDGLARVCLTPVWNG